MVSLSVTILQSLWNCFRKILKGITDSANADARVCLYTEDVGLITVINLAQIVSEVHF